MAASVPIKLTRTILKPGTGMQMPNALVWPASSVRAAQLLCVQGQKKTLAQPADTQGQGGVCRSSEAGGEFTVVGGVVTGHTTPAVSDIGCASVRLRVGGNLLCLRDGGYLLGIRRPGLQWLPAIAGVPGNRGPDRHERGRVGLAECVVMGRPLEDNTRCTFIHDEVLQQLFPLDSPIEVAILRRVTDFFIGLNAGTWLKIRMKQIADASEEFLSSSAGGLPTADGPSILEGTGLYCAESVEEPPPDAAWLFDHWGAGGNTGVSGQKTFSRFDAGKIY